MLVEIQGSGQNANTSINIAPAVQPQIQIQISPGNAAVDVGAQEQHVDVGVTGGNQQIPTVNTNPDPGSVEVNVGGRLEDHASLVNRDLPDQHPISAVTGLEDALNGKQPKGDYITIESDPTVPSWAKQPKKPEYTANEVGALPKDTKIPSKVSELENDSKFATEGYVDKKVSEIEVGGEGTLDHAQLINRDAADQHPMSAITGLNAALEDKQPKGEYAMKDDIPNIPSKISAFENDAGYISSESDPSVPTWAKTENKPEYTASEVGALPADTHIPSKLSELSNDAGFILKTATDLVNYYRKDETYTQEEIDQRISAIPKFSIEVVEALPTEDISTTTVYLLPGGTDDNLYTEHIYVNGIWELLGSQRVDLTGYATEAWVGTQLAEYQPKGDYQPAGDYALKSELPDVPTKLSELSDDADHRLTTDAEKAAWNAKSDFSGKYADLDGKPTIPTVPTVVSAFQNDAGYVSSTGIAYERFTVSVTEYKVDTYTDIVFDIAKPGYVPICVTARTSGNGNVLVLGSGFYDSSGQGGIDRTKAIVTFRNISNTVQSGGAKVEVCYLKES